MARELLCTESVQSGVRAQPGPEAAAGGETSCNNRATGRAPILADALAKGIPPPRQTLSEVAARLSRGEKVCSSLDYLVADWCEFLMGFRMQWFCTMTFRAAVHPEAADKVWRLWVSILNRRLYGPRWHKKPWQQVFWVRALEWQKRDVLHYHALVGDVHELERKVTRTELARTWWHLGRDKQGPGLCKIDLIAPGEESERAVRAYVSKYLAKGGEIDLSSSLVWHLGAGPKTGQRQGNLLAGA